MTISDAYVAGLVDGDGSIWASRLRGRWKTPKSRDSFSCSMTISGQAKWHLELVKGFYGVGHIGCTGQCWTWSVSARQAEAIIRRILPFLVLKKKQAELALEFRKTISHAGSRWDVNVVRQAEIYNEMHELNMYESREFAKALSAKLANSEKPATADEIPAVGNAELNQQTAAATVRLL